MMVAPPCEQILMKERTPSHEACFTAACDPRPQTSSAISTIMRSFAHCSSSARVLPFGSTRSRIAARGRVARCPRI